MNLLGYVYKLVPPGLIRMDTRILADTEKSYSDANANWDGVLSLYGNSLDKNRLTMQLCALHCNLPKQIESEIDLKSTIKFLRSLSPAEHQCS